MIVFEKLRALCQQLPEYRAIVDTNRRTRPRDFYDIITILETHIIDPHSIENVALAQHIFQAKRVPIGFIKNLRADLDWHRQGWKSVQDTVVASEKLKPFDHYANAVLTIFESVTYPADSTDASV